MYCMLSVIYLRVFERVVIDKYRGGDEHVNVLIDSFQQLMTDIHVV